MGNHEVDGVGKKSWFDALTPGVIPDNAWRTPASAPGNNDAAYFSFSYGKKYHFISLDLTVGRSGGHANGTLDSTQYEWFHQELVNNRDKHVFVFCHQPVCLVGLHSNYGYLKHGGTIIKELAIHREQSGGKQAWIFSGHVGGGAMQILYRGVVEQGLQGVNRGNGYIISVNGDSITSPAPSSDRYDVEASCLTPTYDAQNNQYVLTLFDETGGINFSRDGTGPDFTVVGTDGGVVPPQGSNMIKSDPISWYVGPVIFDFVLPVYPGMKLSYWMYIKQADTTLDKISVFPIIMHDTWIDKDNDVTLDANNDIEPKIINHGDTVMDQNGIALPIDKTVGCCSHQLQDPVTFLNGRASNKWYHRVLDFEQVSSGKYALQCLYLSSRANYATADAVYLDDIKFTWPADSGTITVDQPDLVQKRGAEIAVWPNPFNTNVDIRLNSSTVPQFHSSTEQRSVKIFDLNGRLVSNQANYGTVELQNCGTSYRWHANGQPAGIYIIKVRIDDRVVSKRVILLR
jgi:hypothetical protein